MDDDCIFCKIIKGEIPSYTIYQDNKTLAFLDINPNSFGHALIIPKHHARTIIDMQDEDVEAVFKTVKKVVIAIQTALAPDGLNLAVNQGEVAGQVVQHFHCHVIPRTAGDGIELTVKGISLSTEDFQDIVKRISDQIK
ncbi:MAG: HIT family protein [Methanosarcinales archaeon]|nr:HIT family protein [Methanosarcinales archaeon]